MFEHGTSLRHLPFFEEVAAHEEHQAAWRAAAAGLVTLRLFDTWMDDGDGTHALEPTAVAAVVAAIDAMDEGSAARGTLRAIVDSIVSAARGESHEVLTRLLAYASGLENGAQWRLALDVYETTISYLRPEKDPDLTVTAWLRRGVCLRMLTRYEDAETAYLAASDVAMATGDLMGALRAQIGLAKVAVSRGNLPQAESLLEDTIASASQHNIPSARSMALHDRAMVAGIRGDHALSARLAYDALADAPDRLNRDRILSDLGTAFHALGIRTAAQDAFLVLSATASEQYIRWSATISLMTMAAEDGMEAAFSQYNRSLRHAMLPVELEVEYLIRVGQSHSLLGNTDLGQIALTRAIELAEARGLNTLLFEAEGLLQRIPASTIPTPEVFESVRSIAQEMRTMREAAFAAT